MKNILLGLGILFGLSFVVKGRTLQNLTFRFRGISFDGKFPNIRPVVLYDLVNSGPNRVTIPNYFFQILDANQNLIGIVKGENLVINGNAVNSITQPIDINLATAIKLFQQKIVEKQKINLAIRGNFILNGVSVPYSEVFTV